MKILRIFIAIMTITQLCSAQLPCKYVKKTVKELEEQTIYSTFQSGIGNINVIKSTGKGGEQTVIHISTFADYANYSAKGVYLKLSDGTILKDEEVDVDCSYNPDSDSYKYTAYFILNEGNIDSISKNAIVLYSIGGIEKKYNKVNAERLVSAIACVSSIK